jgi:exo-beta-1,3-glucanase (GH17 family)
MSLRSLAAVASLALVAAAPHAAQATGPELAGSAAATRAALQRNQFITYEPGNGWSPGHTVSRAQLTAELTQLRATGLDGVITYGVTDGLDLVPEVAKSVGFAFVIVGLRDPATDWGLITAGNQQWIDGILVGNEGICRGLGVCGTGPPTWTASELVDWIADARQQWPDKLVLTSELWNLYDPGQPAIFQPELLTVESGDVVFPNLLPVWDSSHHVEYCPQVGVEFVQNVVGQNIAAGNPEMPTVLHESWWPSEPTGNTCGGLVGCPGAPNGYSESAQRRFFSLLEGSGVPFVWGEAYDQPWKIEGSNGCGAALGPHWGLWKNDGTPKLVYDVVDRTIFRDGFETGDTSSWSAEP